MNNLEIICKKYVEGNCTEEEKAIAELWFLNELKSNECKINPEDTPKIQQEIWAKIMKNKPTQFLNNRIQSKMKTSMNRAFVLKVSIVAALGGLLFGFDTAIISGAIPYINTYFSLDSYSLGWAVSSILIGCSLGAVGAGKMADLLGRRYVLMICAVLFAISGLGAGLCNSLTALISYRLIGGLGVGAAAMVSPMYIAEIVPQNFRGRLVSLYQLAIVLGILLAYLSNYLFDGTGVNNWRWMFASQTAPALLFFAMLWLVPESPRWLVKVHRLQDAKIILSKTGYDGHEINVITEMQKSFNTAKSNTLTDLFSKKYRRFIVLGILVAVFQQVTGINSVFYYAPLIFKQTGLDATSSLQQTIIMGVVNVVSTFIAIGLVDRLGRKFFLTTGSLVMAVSLSGIALCFYFNYFEHYLVLLFTLVYVAAFGCTLGAVTWVYLSEIFPNRIRAMALSLATLSLWLADFVVTYTFPIMTAKLGTSWTMACYAGCCLIAFLFMRFKLPETKGRSLEEIENLFDKKTEK